MAGESENMLKRHQSRDSSKMAVITYKMHQQPEKQQDLVTHLEPIVGEAFNEEEAMQNAARALVVMSQSIIASNCKVCSEAEKDDKRFLICGHSLCPYKFYHIRCLKPIQIASSAQRDNECWYCPSCLCRTCHINRDDDQIILCDGCDEGYHLYCLTPPLISVPEGQWHCSSCIGQGPKKSIVRLCANEERMRLHEQRILRLHRKNAAIDSALFETGSYLHELADVAEEAESH